MSDNKLNNIIEEAVKNAFLKKYRENAEKQGVKLEEEIFKAPDNSNDKIKQIMSTIQNVVKEARATQEEGLGVRRKAAAKPASRKPEEEEKAKKRDIQTEEADPPEKSLTPRQKLAFTSGKEPVKIPEKTATEQGEELKKADLEIPPDLQKKIDAEKAETTDESLELNEALPEEIEMPGRAAPREAPKLGSSEGEAAEEPATGTYTGFKRVGGPESFRSEYDPTEKGKAVKDIMAIEEEDIKYKSTGLKRAVTAGGVQAGVDTKTARSRAKDPDWFDTSQLGSTPAAEIGGVEPTGATELRRGELEEGGAAARHGNEDKDQGRDRMHADRIHEDEGDKMPDDDNDGSPPWADADDDNPDVQEQMELPLKEWHNNRLYESLTKKFTN